MKKTLILTLGILLSAWTLCPAQEQQTPEATNSSIEVSSTAENSFSGSDRYSTSPQIWSTMKFSGTTPNLYTGTATTAIPILTYEDNDFKIPISLRYASNGYTPNVAANFVGLGWSLDVGGQIVQTINGFPDFSLYYPLAGYSHTQEADNTNTAPSLTASNINETYHMYCGTPQTISEDSPTKYRVETEPDLFSFNFMEHTGKFQFVGKDNIRFFATNHPAGEYALHTSYAWSTDVERPNTLILILSIVTGDGYCYQFETLENSNYFQNFIANMQKGWESLQLNSQQLSETWYLKRIIAPNGRTVSFEYEKDSYWTKRPEDTAELTFINENNRIVSIADLNYESTLARSFPIKTININGQARIEFIYGNRKRELIYSYKKIGVPAEETGCSLKLDSVRLVYTPSTGTEQTIKECSLDYTYNSGIYAQKSNRILFLNSVQIPGTGRYNMEYYGIDKDFPYHQSSDIDHWGYYNAGYNQRPENSDPDDYRHIGDLSQFIQLPAAYNFADLNWTDINTRKPNADFAIRGMLSRITYPTGGYTEFEYEPHQYQDMVTRDASSANRPYLKIGTAPLTAGGLRIKKIVDYPLTGLSNSKTYLYRTREGKSSGNLLIRPYYYFHMDEFDKSTGSCNTRDIWMANNANANVFSTHIEYETVYEVYDDNSFKIYDFANYHDYPDLFRSRQDSLVNPKTYTTNAHRVNNFLTQPDYEPEFRGTLLSSSAYDDQSRLVEQTIYTYDTSKQRAFVESVKYAGDQFYVRRSYVEAYPLTKITTKLFDPQHTGSLLPPVLTTFQEYTYNSRGQIASVSRRESDGTKTTDYTSYVSDLSALRPIHKTMLKYNVLNLPLSKKRTITRPITEDPRQTERITAMETYDYIAVRDSIVRPKSISRAKLQTAQAPTSLPPVETVLTYDTYDQDGRLLQSTDKAGVPTCYLWGYEGLYLVAKIVEKKYDSLPTHYNITNRIPFSTTLPYTFEHTLRQASSGALVTTYDYRPLVGIKKTVDPIGRSTSFTYDKYGRLIAEYYIDDFNPIRTYTYSTANE